jgi:LacI family transcriptional regulator
VFAGRERVSGINEALAAAGVLNDRVALGTYEALNEAGLRMPDDVSIVSFDDSFLAPWLRPALATLVLPHYDMGKRAVELLIENSTGPAEHRIAMPIRHRESVAAARRTLSQPQP